MTREITLATPHFTLRLEDAALMRLARTTTPFVGGDDIIAAFRAVSQALASHPTPSMRLFLDLRDGTNLLRPELESVFRAPFAALARRFGKVAVLHHSAVGKLQIQRFAREENVELQVFVVERLADVFIKDRGSDAAGL